MTHLNYNCIVSNLSVIFLHSALLFCYVCRPRWLHQGGTTRCGKSCPSREETLCCLALKSSAGALYHSKAIPSPSACLCGGGGGGRGSWVCECIVPFIRPRRALLSPSPKLLFIYVMHGNDKSAVINCPCALEDLRREVEGTRHSCPLTNSGCGGREELLEGLECQGKKEVALCARGLGFLGGGRCL